MSRLISLINRAATARSTIRSLLTATPTHHERIAPMTWWGGMPAVRSMAGHSKWKTIKHAKTANDVSRGKVFTKLSREITNAVKEGGGSEDPNLNLKLATVITRARQHDMPMEKIRNAIKSASAKDVERASMHMYEGIGPGGVSILIETLTDNTKRTFPQIKALFTKASCTMGEPGSIAWLFEKKGIVSLKVSDKQLVEALGALGLTPPGGAPSWTAPSLENAALEMGVLAGADDAQADLEEESIHLFCSPSSLGTLRTDLEKLGIPAAALSAKFDYIPKSLVPVDSADAAAKLDAFLDLLDDHPDVMNLYDNWDRDSSARPPSS